MTSKNDPLCNGRPIRRRGAVAVMVTVMLLLLFMCASLAIDVGQIAAVSCEMQNTADGGALAGAIMLRDEKPDEALDAVMDIIAKMQSTLGFSSLDDQVVEFGTWTFADGFQPLGATGAPKAYAVRVLAIRADTPYFFAGVMGKYSTDVMRDAVAVGSEACNGVWGLRGVNAGSINTDSYISTDGFYSEGTARKNGDICSGRDIKIHGSKEIEGDVQAGFGYGVTVAGESGYITGLTTTNAGDAPTVPVDVGDAPYVNDNDLMPPSARDGTTWYRKSEHVLEMSGGGELALPTGVLYFDSIKLAGGSTLSVSGPTTIYVSGDFDTVGGAIVNKTQDPNNLTIISIGDDMKLGGSADFYGTILAPKAVATLNSGTLYGVIIAGFLELRGDYTVHVDESLPYAKHFEAPAAMLVE